MITNHYTLALSAPTGGPVHDPQPGDMVANMWYGHRMLGMVLENLANNRVKVLWPDISESLLAAKS